MMSGFKQFVLRGNVVDMAVGVVVGGAFAAVVAALTKDLLTPLIAALADHGRGMEDALSRLDDSEKEALRKLLRKLRYAAENQATTEGSAGRGEPATGERS